MIEIEPESDSDARFREGLGIVIFCGLTLVPLLAGWIDMRTFLVVAVIGSIVILPVWRYAGEALNTPKAIIAFLELFPGVIVIDKLFSAPAMLTYFGAWACTLSLMRFASHLRDGGRDDVERPSGPHDHHHG